MDVPQMPPKEVYGLEDLEVDIEEMQRSPSHNVSTELEDVQEEVQEERNLCLLVCTLSFPDIVLSAAVLSVALSHAARDNGVSLYCLGIQALAHGLSSILLLRRFHAEYKVLKNGVPDKVHQSLLRDERRTSLTRESRVSLFMGAVMALSSVALLTKAVRKFLYWEAWYNDRVALDRDVGFATRFLAIYGLFIYLFQAAFRFFVWRRLKRGILHQAWVCSVVSVLFMLVLGAAAGYENELSWKVEPVVAIFLSLATVGHSLYIITRHLTDVDARLKSNPLA